MRSELPIIDKPAENAVAERGEEGGNEIMGLINSIENPALKEYALQTMQSVYESLGKDSLEVGKLAVAMPNLLLKMSDIQRERLGEGFVNEQDIERFQKFQAIMTELLNARTAEIRPRETKRKIESFITSMESHIKSGDFKYATTWIDYNEQVLSVLEKGRPADERRITDEGIVEMERLIAKYRAQIEKLQAK